MFSKILIANRGEIAVRIIHACKELGVRTVAVYSEADKKSLHVELADEAYCVGKAKSEESYLNYPEIVYLAKRVHADAIHPGYGFLAENPLFVEVCEICNITFIGPSSNAIAKMGAKSVARNMMIDAHVPVPPGSRDAFSDDSHAQRTAEKVGFPLLLKASAGGGGKGMRIVHRPEEFIENLHAAQAEAGAAFGNKEMYIEKLVQNARHIEIQVLADNYGNTIHLGERECSIQRRHQKLLEEAPSSALTPRLREKMGKAAVRAAKKVDYRGAGTVEFLLDESGDFHFIEMNTRIQVEHPITEAVTDTDLVKWQIQIAAGRELTLRQKDITPKGHAIECRINAEDPDKNFMPSPGKIRKVVFAGGPGIRIDTHIYSGYALPPHYDSLLAKMVAYGDTRQEAIDRMLRALNETTIEGIKTTIPFHKKILVNPHFRSGDYNTNFIEQHLFI